MILRFRESMILGVTFHCVLNLITESRVKTKQYGNSENQRRLKESGNTAVANYKVKF